MFLATCYEFPEEAAQDSPNIYHIITMTFLRDEEPKILFQDKNK